MPPHTCQPGQQILILGQLHLEPALPGVGPLGKDVQDQPRPVDDLGPHLFGEDPLLGGESSLSVSDLLVQTELLVELGHASAGIHQLLLAREEG